ncbi:F-box protein [Quillaja saponaria]|uniref:F-box protein n=1 Tax=Quillaja saponaria TaxID=32244 RepID=A0AAD7KW88_QUISA|nr:F-box protein [Quillaja saponaria]
MISKRWQCLWMSLPELDFAQGTVNKKARSVYMSFVGRALMLCNSTDIKKFSLSCDLLCDELRISTWIFGTVRQNVEVLDLCLLLLTKPLILILSLQMCCNLKLPSVISLSSFKIMTLTHVMFPDHAIDQLLSGCPILENLTLDECYWENVTSVSISGPTLRTLVVYDFLDDKNDCQVLVSGTMLKSFVYEGKLKRKYCLLDSPSLEDACINVDGDQSKCAIQTCKLMRGLSNVNRLVMSSSTNQALSQTKESLDPLPMFHKLKHLEVNVEYLDMSYGALLDVLQNSPFLTYLEFTKGIDLEVDHWELDPIPPCFLTYLKVIKFGDFLGLEDERIVIRVLLQKAAVLERMTIHWSEEEFTGVEGFRQQMKVNAEVQVLPKSIKKLCYLSHLANVAAL